MKEAECVEALTDWYLVGSALHPTPAHLRAHVTSLTTPDAGTLTLHFPDTSVTLSHAQLSTSPWRSLRPVAHLTLPAPSAPFHTIKQYLYCTPLNLSAIPPSLVNAAWAWRLYELHAACFLVAETSLLDIVDLLHKYLPLCQNPNLPDRFRAYLAGRIAIDAPTVRAWIHRREEGGSGGNRLRLDRALRNGGISGTTRSAMRRYSELDETEILAGEGSPAGQFFNLVWRLPLAGLLARGKDYAETEVTQPGISACMEVSWAARGMRLVVGVQRVEEGVLQHPAGLVDVGAAVIGLPCECADARHNGGWMLDGGVQRRTLDWVLAHEVGFGVFGQGALRRWREVHDDCGVLVKVRVRVSRGEDING